MTLEEIYEEIRADPFWEHLRLPGIRLVPGFGRRDPEVLVVGEAPGATENTRLRPFCGASGTVLQQLMGLAGLRLEDAPPDGPGQQPTALANCFITNVVKYRPPNNRTPTPEEIVHAQPALRAEWAALGRPSVIVAVGNPAQAALGCYGQMRGRPYEARGVTFWPMYHPAFAMRHRSIRSEVEQSWEVFGEWLAGR